MNDYSSANMQNGAQMKMRQMWYVPTSTFFTSAFISFQKCLCGGGGDKYITYCYLQ
jgi:hypothetical protein